jgi:leader peptidase (prepilin peptidase)/N-methyltransferase
MGLGDAKLLFAVGCWFGLPGALFSLLAGAVQGTLLVFAVFVARGKVEEPQAVKEERRALQEHLAALPEDERKALEADLADDPLAFEAKPGLGQARLAFGPFLALAALEYMIWGDAIKDRYFAWILGQ